MATTKEKGDILEQVVAWLHEEPGVTVQRNARLPMLGSRRRTRDIDVLLTSYVAGHQVRLAIECKNEEARIGAPKIDAFRGKLEALGIPPSFGIYVSASGYTEGAQEAARAAGIRMYTIEGLSADRLSLAVHQAFQSLVVLLPDVNRVWLANDLAEPVGDVNEAFLFYDEMGQPVGTVQDLVWQAWQTGDLAPHIGRTGLLLQIPESWYNLIADRKQPVRFLSVTVDIIAFALTFQGAARTAALVPVDDGTVVRERATAGFETPSGRYEIKAFRSEEELQRHLTSEGIVHLVHRVRSPRIRFWNMMFWPPSQRVADVIATQMRLFDEGRIPDPRPFSFEQIEGSDLGAAWEPIAEDYLAGLDKQEEGRLWRSA